jgi:hypothetical protein
VSNPWDEFSAGGDFVEFNNVGDEVIGTILNISAKRWDDGKVSPQLGLRLDNGDEVTLTAGWVMLVKALKDLAPNVGDRIRVKMTGKGPKPKETREWSVEILGAATVPTPAPAAPSVAGAPAADVRAFDPLAGLSAEQRAALGLPPVEAAAPAWDSDPRVAPLRAAGVSDDVIRATLGL